MVDRVRELVRKLTTQLVEEVKNNQPIDGYHGDDVALIYIIIIYIIITYLPD